MNYPSRPSTLRQQIYTGNLSSHPPPSLNIIERITQKLTTQHLMHTLPHIPPLLTPHFPTTRFPAADFRPPSMTEWSVMTPTPPPPPPPPPQGNYPQQPAPAADRWKTYFGADRHGEDDDDEEGQSNSGSAGGSSGESSGAGRRAGEASARTHTTAERYEYLRHTARAQRDGMDGPHATADDAASKDDTREEKNANGDDNHDGAADGPPSGPPDTITPPPRPRGPSPGEHQPLPPTIPLRSTRRLPRPLPTPPAAHTPQLVHISHTDLSTIPDIPVHDTRAIHPPPPPLIPLAELRARMEYHSHGPVFPNPWPVTDSRRDTAWGVRLVPPGWEGEGDSRVAMGQYAGGDRRGGVYTPYYRHHHHHHQQRHSDDGEDQQQQQHPNNAGDYDDEDLDWELQQPWMPPAPNSGRPTRRRIPTPFQPHRQEVDGDDTDPDESEGPQLQRVPRAPTPPGDFDRIRRVGSPYVPYRRAEQEGGPSQQQQRRVVRARESQPWFTVLGRTPTPERESEMEMERRRRRRGGMVVQGHYRAPSPPLPSPPRRDPHPQHQQQQHPHTRAEYIHMLHTGQIRPGMSRGAYRLENPHATTAFPRIDDIVGSTTIAVSVTDSDMTLPVSACSSVEGGVLWQEVLREDVDAERAERVPRRRRWWWRWLRGGSGSDGEDEVTRQRELDRAIRLWGGPGESSSSALSREGREQDEEDVRRWSGESFGGGVGRRSGRGWWGRLISRAKGKGKGKARV